MSIYFLRHGESEANVKGVFDGQGLNSELTILGGKQAEQAAQELTSIDIKDIYSSPLKRTRKTAEIVSDRIGFPLNQIKFDDRLMEHDVGRLSGLPYDTDEYLKAKLIGDAENNIKFQKRILSFLHDHKDDKYNMLMVSHGGVGSMIEASRRGLDVSEFYEVVSYPNAHIVPIDLDWLK
ncbi:MAG TPA: histidine phosphatase family protein [Candidatus Dormibacteraeota bacterium]|nr:histidine phosphatase family protein [Candidatus Dormibacteraeota bacterium]